MSGVHVLQVHTPWWCPGVARSWGEPRTQHVSTHTRMTQKHTQHTQHTRKHARRHSLRPRRSLRSRLSSRRVEASRLPRAVQRGERRRRRGLTSFRGKCSAVRGARWVAHDVSWKWKWYLVIFLVLNRGEEMWAGRCRCGPRERGTALAVLYIEWHLTWMREWMRGLVRDEGVDEGSCTRTIVLVIVLSAIKTAVIL